ncbi:unnamed protein product [Gemmata massiliana]|uniref:Uncharacterized protein n=1 Tax=Gemmata massiliana TaxID=1210884 RepID=A0A6P2DLF2_9BACT|nr:hypothetical protein [Gemmata massiliana]VTS01446.1 unnamed protein product [Gemmata massiliana]
MNARVTYRATERVYFSAGYENTTESYFLAYRLDKDDRFFSFEQRLLTGVRWDVCRNATLDLNAGCSFGREYGEGRNQGASLHDRVKVDPGVFLGVNFRMRF